MAALDPILPRRAPRTGGALAWVLAMYASVAVAGEPLVTDDASVVDAGTCQVEAWAMPARDARTLAVQPACNLVADTELALGASRTWQDDAGTSNSLLVQLKHVFVADPDGAWALGATLGAQRDTPAPAGGSPFDTTYAKAIATWNTSDSLELDVNAGVAHTRGSGRYALGAVAVQYAVVPAMKLLGEVYHDEPGTGKVQAGVRFVVVPDRFEVYGSYGERLANRGDWWAIVGVRLQSRKLLRRRRA
jgi:hypothetical protein